jgi:hypothetical protein
LCAGFQYDPRFGLSGLASWQQVSLRVPGVHLDRDHVTCVEELQQQREVGETPGQPSLQLLWKLLQQLTDGPPFERSIGNTSLVVFAVAE